MESSPEAVTVDRVAALVGQGGYWSRKQIAEAFGRDKTSHVILTIERAVGAGLIKRFPGYIGSSYGWVYAHPDLQPELF